MRQLCRVDERRMPGESWEYFRGSRSHSPEYRIDAIEIDRADFRGRSRIGRCRLSVHRVRNEIASAVRRWDVPSVTFHSGVVGGVYRVVNAVDGCVTCFFVRYMTPRNINPLMLQYLRRFRDMRNISSAREN